MIGIGIGIGININGSYFPLVPTIIIWNDSDTWNDSNNWIE